MAPPALRSRDDLRTYHWRHRVRPLVYVRDNGICHICHQPIDLNIKHPDPMSYEVDHTRGVGTGHDTTHLRAAHKICNQRQGDPTRNDDPKPRGMTRW